MDLDLSYFCRVGCGGRGFQEEWNVSNWCCFSILAFEPVTS